MDKQNIQLYKYLTDPDKTMNREKMRKGCWMEGKGRSIHPSSEYTAESMAHKESQLKGFCTGTRLLIQDMHENSLSYRF